MYFRHKPLCGDRRVGCTIVSFLFGFCCATITSRITRMRHSLTTIAFLLLATALCLGQANLYSSWPNFPQSNSFFPIVMWLQPPTRTLGAGSPYTTDAAAMAATKMNVLLAIDGGGGGNYPGSYGADTGGQFQALVNNGIYGILAADTTGNSSVTSVASLKAMAASLNASSYLIGYNLGDEPQSNCSLVSGVPAITAMVSGYDSTRPLFWNHTDWTFGHGVCSGNPAALQATSVGSFDLYPLISPWNGASSIPVVSGQAQDSMWIQGYSVNRFIASGRPGQPIWGYVDTGTNALGYSSQNNSACNVTTNLCAPDNHEYRATAEQVNAEVWMSVINGAMGIEYFCDDTSLATGQTAYDFCLGNNASGEGSAAAAIASNLTYIDTTLLSFAPQLNSPVLGICTMNTGTSYINYTTSCSNGILTMSTATSTVPGSAIVKNYNGTLYLFADSDRNGSATMTFTLSGYAGQTATVVYDSNAHYDSAHSSVGNTFTLNANGQFSDSFGSNGHNYQPKIYKIAGTGTAPAPPTNVSATPH